MGEHFDSSGGGCLGESLAPYGGGAGLRVSMQVGSIPAPRAGANVACVCPDIEQRERGKTMGFMTDVTGDALERMQEVWDDVDSFTRSELGGAPDWADYVNLQGELYAERELVDEFMGVLNEVGGVVEVCGHHFDAGRVIRELDPIAFREELLFWIDAQVRDGELRSIEGR